MNSNGKTDYHLLAVSTDDAGIADISRNLSELNCVTTQSVSLDQAETVLADQLVDIVLLDDGAIAGNFETAFALIRSHKANMPVIVMSENSSVETAIECMKLGAKDFLVKPDDLPKLTDSVAELLESIQPATADLSSMAAGTENRGRVLAGYRLGEIISEGRLGRIYQATKLDDADEQMFALKILRPDQVEEDVSRDFLERFMNEAEAASRVKVNGVVEIVDYGLAEEEMIPYIVMEYIPGKALDHYIRDSIQFDYRRKAEILLQVATALAAIHKQNIIHRDIKPENIVIDNNETVKLIDFGVAKLPESNLTVAGDRFGTPCYMSPEGFVSSRLDHRSDIFSFGIVAYEFFLRRAPFAAETITDLAQEISRIPPVEPRKISGDFPLELQTVLSKMLKKHPDDRYQSATDIANDLNDYLQTHHENFSQYLETNRRVFLEQVKTQILERDWN